MKPHEKLVSAGAAVDENSAYVLAEIALHRMYEIEHLIGYALESGAHDMRPVHSAGKTAYYAACLGIPIRRAEPHECGNYVCSAGIAYGKSKAFAFRRRGNHAELVPKPLNERARNEHTAFENIIGLTVDRRRKSGYKSPMTVYSPVSRVHQKKAARTVCVFDLSARKAPLSEQRGLLIARDGSYGNARARQTVRNLAEHVRRRTNFRKHGFGHPENLHKIGVPAFFVYIEKHGARGVRIVRSMDLAARQIPQEKAVHRPEQELAALCPLPHAFYVFENPLEFRGGKVRVHGQSRTLVQKFLISLFHKATALTCRPATLPNYCVINGLSACLVPDDDRFALIGYAYRRNVETLGRLFYHVERRGEKIIRVVLDISGLRIYLLELAPSRPYGIAAFVEYYGARAGSPLIERQYVFLGHLPNLRYGMLVRSHYNIYGGIKSRGRADKGQTMFEPYREGAT